MMVFRNNSYDSGVRLFDVFVAHASDTEKKATPIEVNPRTHVVCDRKKTATFHTPAPWNAHDRIRQARLYHVLVFGIAFWPGRDERAEGNPY